MNPFDTVIENNGAVISGPFRHPRQMLQHQTYEAHASIHDDSMAQELGFSGAPIEGPTHFSQFEPLLYSLFGQAWYEHGCISSHYQNMVVEGEEVRAFAEKQNTNSATIWAEKRDGTHVLSGTASIGPSHPKTALDERRERLRPSEQLIIMADVEVGMRSDGKELVVMGFDQHMGDLYPFTLQQKLDKITELNPWFSAEKGKDSPWGRPIIPFEMISVLTQYTSRAAGFPVKGPAVGLFADQEIKLTNGPLFVDQHYRLEREVVALSESRRVESCWTITRLYDVHTNELCCESLLNHAIVKESYANYTTEAAAVNKT